MKKCILFILCLIGTIAYGQNTFKYEVRANGGLRVGGSTFAEIDSITLQAGKLRIMSGATLQKIAGHVLYTDTITMLTKYARKASPTFTGVVKLATDTLATRAYARASGGGGTSIDTTSLSARIDLKAPIASPTFTGTVTGTFSGNVTGNVSGSAGTIVNGTTSTGGNVALVSASNPTTVRYSPNLQYTELIEALSSTNFLAGSLTNGTYYSANGITSVGSASNIDFTITPKGTGVIKKSTTDTLATQAYARTYGGTGTVTIDNVRDEVADSLNVLRSLYFTLLDTRVDSIVDVLADSINIETLLQVDLSRDTLSTKAYARSVGGGGSGVTGVTLNSGKLTLTGDLATADSVSFYTNGNGEYNLPSGGGNLTIQSQVQGWINDSLDVLRTADSDTIPLFIFGLGSGHSSDTAVFNNGRLAGAFYNSGSDTLYVTELRGVLVEGTGTETIDVQVSWDANMKDATPTNLNTTALTVTSMTTGTVDTTFDNNGIPPDTWVWCTLSGASSGNKPTMLILTMTGYRRNRSY